jgi:hypothetical protein
VSFTVFPPLIVTEPLAPSSRGRWGNREKSTDT